jgi:hypothetical protein
LVWPADGFTRYDKVVFDVTFETTLQEFVSQVEARCGGHGDSSLDDAPYSVMLISNKHGVLIWRDAAMMTKSARQNGDVPLLQQLSARTAQECSRRYGDGGVEEERRMHAAWRGRRYCDGVAVVMSSASGADVDLPLVVLRILPLAS